MCVGCHQKDHYLKPLFSGARSTFNEEIRGDWGFPDRGKKESFTCPMSQDWFLDEFLKERFGRSALGFCDGSWVLFVRKK